jgi:hypothetical protein
MSKKILIMLVAIVTGAFLVPGAMAVNFADLAHNLALLYTPGIGTPVAAGTILNPEGKGDVLICPYYDVRPVNGTPQENYITIINENMSDATDGGVAAKLRFREWDKSEEVFDIDIWLSENDVWVAVLTRNTTTGLTNIVSPDYVITAPAGPSGSTFTVSKTTQLATGIDFSSALVPGGTNNSKTPPIGFSAAWTAADMTNLGYFEIIGEERTVSTVDSTGTKVTRLGSGNTELDCPNSLSAFVFVVNVQAGVAAAYNCTAIANFVTLPVSLFAGAGSTTPRLDSGQDGIEQLEFQLSKARIYQGYSIEASVNAAFNLIVTFPTKHFHFAERPTYTASLGALTLPFVGGAPTATSHHANDGEEVGVTIFDRDEHTAQQGFISPRISSTFVLPYEVNVVGLFKTAPEPISRDTRSNLGWSTGTFESGWLWVNLFNGQHYFPLDDGFGYFGQLFDGYFGLPGIAMALQEFENLTLVPGGFYGDFLPAFYEVNWLPNTGT